MITSSSNAQVKQMIQLNKKARERRKQDVFIVEGLRMFREVPRDRLVKTYVSENFLEDPEHEALLQGIPYEVVKDSVFAQMSDTLTPQGVLTVVRQYHYTMEELMGEKEHPLFLVLEDLQDPGNMGTIFRTAEGAGVDGIFMSTNCVDIYNPKTIRSTMGSVYRVPFVIAPDLQDVFAWFKKQGIRSYAAHLKGKGWYDEQSYVGGTAFLIGNEGNGLTDATAGQADCLIRIPMKGQLESLNAGVAAAILMYEASRVKMENVKEVEKEISAKRAIEKAKFIYEIKDRMLDELEKEEEKIHGDEIGGSDPFTGCSGSMYFLSGEDSEKGSGAGKYTETGYGAESGWRRCYG